MIRSSRFERIALAKRAAHPTYPNPTLVEALCEVHLRLGPERPWRPTTASELYKRIQDRYPTFEPINELGVQISFGSQGVIPQVAAPRTRMKFTHRDRPVLLQLSEQVLTLNVLKPYPGWAVMREELLKIWPPVLQVLEPIAVRRIGLRYINRIEKTSNDEKAGAWLKSTDYIPRSILLSVSGSALRVECRVNSEDHVILTLVDQPPQRSEDRGTLIFDIDRIRESEMEPTEASILDVIEQLHNDVWKIFAKAKTRRLEQLLAGEMR